MRRPLIAKMSGDVGAIQLVVSGSPGGKGHVNLKYFYDICVSKCPCLTLVKGAVSVENTMS